MQTGICARCGATFTATGKGRRRKYCGKACYQASDVERNRLARGSTWPRIVECAECRKTFEAMSPKARYCSKACGQYRRNHGESPTSSRSCIVCHASIPRRSILRKFCGKACEQIEEARLRRLRVGQDFGSQALTLGSILEKTDDD